MPINYTPEIVELMSPNGASADGEGSGLKHWLDITFTRAQGPVAMWITLIWLPVAYIL